MKLIIRSSYWGNILKGKPRVDAANPARSFRTISSQAVLTIEGKYWGCCQGQGKRVLEMTEQHFMDTFAGDWDLYLVGSTSNESEAIHTFFLLPQNQNSVDVRHHLCYNAWQYYGTISAMSMRQQLNEILADTFAPNETIGFRYHHVHIEILMSQVTDYAARAKKANSSGKTSPVSENLDANETPKSQTPIPGVSKSASHDASATEATSSPSTCTSYHEVHHEVPQFVPSGSFDPEMICYPHPMPYPVIHTMPATMYHHHHHNYAVPAYMPMHMGIVPPNAGLAPPSAGLAPYNMYHPVNQMAHATNMPAAPPQEPSKESTKNTASSPT
ncbi:unnamed protein product [Cylindrotheca closterium]|uniref:Uncharacterized protein n=1 Tax=Cylindrotheca closterium TaxID=2856 RepID=A0AAD2FW06_9STRA|nr:unnamed protein product [Cylindrotheca closterium]